MIEYKKFFLLNSLVLPLLLSFIVVSPAILGNSDYFFTKSDRKNIVLLQNQPQEFLVKEISEKELCVNSELKVQYYDKRYAVILVGYFNDSQHYNWYTRDAQRQYDVLTKKYNFSDNDIYMLVTQKKEWVDNLSMDPAVIDYNATKTNISMVFTHLASIIDEDDLLYVVVIDHGADTHHLFFKRLGIDIDFWQGVFAHDTYFALEKTGNTSENTFIPRHDLSKNITRSEIGERIYDHELNEYTQKIHARRIIFVLQPCFSGGFINDLSGTNHVVLTASTEAQQANAPFIGYFYFGLNGSSDDSNHDGRISLGEIYEYSADMVYEWIQKDPEGNGGRHQYPLIDDNGDKIGHRYNSSFGYTPEVVNKDGYIAARIYNLSYEELSV
jgi:hypothetical protein